jgi:hypothetical protein
MFAVRGQNWVNPAACRAETEMQRYIGQMLHMESNKMTVDYPETWQQTQNKIVHGKWQKFWYAVHMLHRWVTCEPDFNLKDKELQKYQSAFFACTIAGARIVRKNDLQTDYLNAGLLAAESVDDWDTFYYCRKLHWSHLGLNDTDLTNFMEYLLERRREAVLMFEKTDLLDGLLTKTKECTVRVQGVATMRQLSGAELDQFRTDDTALRVRRQQEQAAAAAAWPARKALEDAAMKAIPTAQDEQEAAAGLLALGGGGAHVRNQTVCMLLQCLHRLTL